MAGRNGLKMVGGNAKLRRTSILKQYDGIIQNKFLFTKSVIDGSGLKCLLICKDLVLKVLVCFFSTDSASFMWQHEDNIPNHMI